VEKKCVKKTRKEASKVMCTTQDIAKAVANEMCPTCEHIIECDFNCMKVCGEMMRQQMETKGEAKILEAKGETKAIIQKAEGYANGKQ
jgi:hypothetical protein